jgi:hypothetical protein
MLVRESSMEEPKDLKKKKTKQFSLYILKKAKPASEIVFI